MIRITAKPAQGFNRCGVHHPNSAVDHPDERFSPEQLDLLKAEPMLVVEEIDGEPEHPANGLTPNPSPKGEGSADLDARNKALGERELALDGREDALRKQSQAVEELKADERFRHIVLLFAVQAVVEGKQPGDLTKSGAPTTEAIAREALGFYTVTAKERDELFAEVYPDGAE